MKHTIIVTGGTISKKWIKQMIDKEKNPNVIAVDKGLEVLEEIGVIPKEIIGDFDSVNQELLKKYQSNPMVCCHTYLPEKDDTDTELAIKLAIARKSDQITILGGVGTRWDHSLANIHVMKLALEKGIFCEMIDEYNRIYLVNQEMTIVRENQYGSYVSLIPLTSKVTGLTLTGFRYPLTKAVLEIGRGLGISNEVKEKRANIELEEGILIVMETKD